MKIALDTNVLVHAEGANGAAMRDKALELILSRLSWKKWRAAFRR